jgi:serine/threonine-protein kinase
VAIYEGKSIALLLVHYPKFKQEDRPMTPQSQPTVELSNANLIGTVINERYRLDSLIGAGGMGTVYRATRTMINDTVAVKIMHPQLLADNLAAERFQREAQAAARLKHQNAVAIYDFGSTENGMFYIVMELVEGQSLRQIINTQGALTVTTTAEILTQVCSALDEAHRNNIIHRDLKPDNIIVTPQVGGLQVKILDFGVAKLRDEGVSNLTQTGNVMGTPHYMSPEQCLGEELDHRSDIYSLGIVLYEMLSGRVPFSSPTSTAVVVQHVNQQPTSLRTINLGISPEIDNVVMLALAKNRNERPQTTALLANIFNSALNATVQPPTFTAPLTYPQPVMPQQSYTPQQPMQPYTVPTPQTSGQTSGYMPTMVMSKPTISGSQPLSGSFSTTGTQPTNTSQKNIMILLVGLILVAGVVIVYLLTQNKKEKSNAETASASVTPNAETASASVTPTATATPTPNQVVQTEQPSMPEGAKKIVICNRTGVNLRQEPTSNSFSITKLSTGQKLYVFSESTQPTQEYVRHAGAYITDYWSEVALYENPSIRGWVFNYFLSQ